MIKDRVKGDNWVNINQVMKDVGISPHTNTKGKRGKVKVNKPTRFSARRDGRDNIQ